MSKPTDKKTESANRRLERTQKELLEKRRIRNTTTIVIVVLAALFACALFLNSKLIRRMLPAVTFGDISFTAVEFDYFYNNAYLEFSDMINSDYPDYASMLPTGKPFSSQQNYLTGSGEPWSEYFTATAMENMAEMAKYYSAAKEAGFELTAEQLEELDEQVELLVNQASWYGYPSFVSFLQAVYGSNINESSFKKIIAFTQLAKEYGLQVYDSFKYDEGALKEYYSENRDDMDLFTFRNILISPEEVDREEYESDDEYDEAVEAATEAARLKAEQIMAEIASEDDFIAAAAEYDENRYSTPDSTLVTYPGSWISESYSEWMKSPERAEGDMYTADVASGTYIIYYVYRDSNDYHMAEMRQILIMAETISPDDYAEGEEDPEYIEALAAAETALVEKAETVLALFIEGGKTEEALMMLMADYSDDNTEGGYYDQISKDPSHRKMIAEVEDFLFDPARKYGDYELVRSEQYGYHLLFYMGSGELYCDYAAETALRNKDYQDWSDGLEENEPVTRWAFNMTTR